MGDGGGFWGDVKNGVWDGDFSENDSWTKTVSQVVTGLIPGVGQVADARDTIAAARDVWNGKDGGWTNLALAGIGWVPLLGDGVKGGVRITRKAVRATAEVVAKSADEIAAALRSTRYLGETKKFPIPAGVKDDFSQTFARREAARKEMNTLAAKEKAGTLTDAEKQTLTDARRETTVASRELGEKAGDAFVARDFPGAEKVYPPAGAPSRSGDFDQVYKAKDPQTGDDVWVVVEAKGGESRLADRALGDGTRADQGSAKYFDSIVEQMKKSPEGRQVASELEAARLSENVRYFEARAPISSGKTPALKDLEVSEFDLRAPK